MANVIQFGADSIDYDIKDATARSNIATIQSDITTINGDIDAVEGDVSALGTRVTTAEGNITTLQGTATNLQGQIDALQATSSNNFLKLPDGTMIQWSYISENSFTLDNGFLSATVNMSYAFINTSYTVMLTTARNGIAYLTSPVYESNKNGNQTRTTTSFAITAKGTSKSITVYWLAIGRWK